MKSLNIGGIKLPLNAATKTFAVLAKRGAGKTYTAAVLAEEFFSAGIPFVIFDPIDVWWGLRLDKDGKSKGMPIVVFGKENADIQLERDMGKAIAQSIVRENISCVLSTFGMPKVAQRQLIADFSEELLRINNSPRHVFIEEAHEFVPQRVFGAMSKCFSAVESLVVMGRNRGIGVTLINQRAATVNKDVLTQLDTLMAFRNTAPQDRKALKEWVEAHGAEDDFDMFMKSLPSLPTGEGWIWSPEFMSVFKRVKIRKRNTFHPDREKLGKDFEMPVIEQTDIREFIKKFSKESPKKSEATGESKSLKIDDSSSQKIQEIRNEYESRLMEKDIIINGLNERLNKIASIIGVNSTAESNIYSMVDIQACFRNSNVDMWIDKLGRSTCSGKILEFLAKKKGLKFTRSQMALATGYSVNSGGFNQALANLKKNKLVYTSGGNFEVSHDL